MKKNIKTILLSILFVGLSFTSIFTISRNADLSKELIATQENLTNTKQQLEKYMNTQHSDSLSEWDMFTLALMKVESNYVQSTVSSAGAKGYFQFMPVYVDEVNRIHGTNYKFEDVVKSFEQSYEVFTLMQKAKNKNFSMDKALTLHNGDHDWYHNRVYKEMEIIERYEMMRQMLKKARSEFNEDVI